VPRNRVPSAHRCRQFALWDGGTRRDGDGVCVCGVIRGDMCSVSGSGWCSLVPTPKLRWMDDAAPRSS
jgi:hypothetical protein